MTELKAAAAQIPPPQPAAARAAQLRGTHAAFFIDNDAARLGCVKGYSPSLPSAKLIGKVWLKMAELSVSPWFARVPTQSNIADAPSRGKIPGMFKVDEAVVPKSWS